MKTSIRHVKNLERIENLGIIHADIIKIMNEMKKPKAQHVTKCEIYVFNSKVVNGCNLSSIKICNSPKKVCHVKLKVEPTFG